jgi:hypothetical protein
LSRAEGVGASFVAVAQHDLEERGVGLFPVQLDVGSEAVVQRVHEHVVHHEGPTIRLDDREVAALAGHVVDVGDRVRILLATGQRAFDLDAQRRDVTKAWGRQRHGDAAEVGTL